MKKINTILLFCLLSLAAWSQAPQQFSFQTVVRNASGQLQTNSPIQVRNSILQGSPTGSAVYVEIIYDTTNANGLASFAIGSGTVIGGNLSTINWGAGPYFIKTEMLLSGSTGYDVVSVNQFLSVPYALFAANAGSGVTGPTGPTGSTGFLAPGAAEGNTPFWNGTKWVDSSNLYNAGANIGIGTTTPVYKLDVNGDGRFSGVVVGVGNYVAGNNTVLGNNALSGITTGAADIAVGFSSQANTSSGSANNSVGYGALIANTDGWLNNAFGYFALSANINGSANTGIGDLALNNSTGSENTALGASAGTTNNIGSNNTFIGRSADAGFDSLMFATAIGAKALVSSDYSVVLGCIAGVNGASQSSNVGIGTTSPAARLHIVGNIKIVDGTQAAGKVLTSDANGLASWQNPSGSHYIGEVYGGGVVFYVYDNGLHGLIASTIDQSTGVIWDNGNNDQTDAASDGIGGGKANTFYIRAVNGYANYAARLCDIYNAGGFGDWYLPSKYELNLLYAQKAVVGGFANAAYWSSSEYNSLYGYEQDFSNGTIAEEFKTATNRVRAIRAF